MDRHSDTALLTYPELAARFGITLASARRRVLRSKWRKIAGNDGKLRIVVPVEALPLVVPTVVPTVTVTSVPTSVPTNTPLLPHVTVTEEALSRLLTSLGDAVELRERLAKAEADHQAAERARQVEEARAQQAERAAQEAAAATAKALDALRASEAQTAALEAELAMWSEGNPLARAFRAFAFKRR